MSNVHRSELFQAFGYYSRGFFKGGKAFKKMMRIISSEIVEEAGNIECFPIHDIAVLMCCTPELSSPMAMVPHNDIIVSFELFFQL